MCWLFPVIKIKMIIYIGIISSFHVSYEKTNECVYGYTIPKEEILEPFYSTTSLFLTFLWSPIMFKSSWCDPVGWKLYFWLCADGMQESQKKLILDAES